MRMLAFGVSAEVSRISAIGGSSALPLQYAGHDRRSMSDYRF